MIEARDLRFTYSDGRKALDGVSFTIKNGEFVLVTGGSGSGKTTLARCLNGLVPHFYGGELKGSLFVDGKRPSEKPVKEMAKLVGMVFQDPEAMFVSEDVEGEIGFGPTCMGYTTGELKKSTDAVVKRMGIEELRKRSLHELSGGEKQKVAIASVLVTKPKILVLDEPLSELDHKSADSLMETLKRLNKSGITIIIIEQRTERVCGCARREIVLEKGKVKYDGVPKGGGRPAAKAIVKPGDVLVKLDDVSFSYGSNPVLTDFSGKFREGEIVVLEGPNGCGKTTLLKLIMGLLKPDSGVVNVGGLENPSVEKTAGNVGYVFQNPDNHLFAESVGEEIKFILDNTGRPGDVDGILKKFKILHYKKDYPRYLSGGEKQRVALASIMVAAPRVLLLDEPTRGMDHGLKRELGEFLSDYAKRGLVVMATHDDFMASCATRRVKIMGGRDIGV